MYPACGGHHQSGDERFCSQTCKNQPITGRTGDVMWISMNRGRREKRVEFQDAVPNNAEAEGNSDVNAVQYDDGGFLGLLPVSSNRPVDSEYTTSYEKQFCKRLNAGYKLNDTFGGWTNTQIQRIGSNGIYCNATCDGYLCWPPALAGETLYQNCPSRLLSNEKNCAFRRCGSQGQWLGRHLNDTSPKGWTNFTPCFPVLVQKILEKVNEDEAEAQLKFETAVITRIIEMVGIVSSFLTICAAIVIFNAFPSLHNRRTVIHRNLFYALLMEVTVRMVLYTQQSNSFDAVDPKEEDPRKGIEYFPYVCEGAYVLLEYSRLVVYGWMFIEGIFLNTLISANTLRNEIPINYFYVGGWGVPAILIATWATVVGRHYSNESINTCWYGYNYLLSYYIIQGPILAVVSINILFLGTIMSVIIMKLRRTNDSELRKIQKTIRATLILLPLLGIINIFNLFDYPLDGSSTGFAIWAYFTHFFRSFQGVFISFIYCFSNGEVRKALMKKWERRTWFKFAWTERHRLNPPVRPRECPAFAVVNNENLELVPVPTRNRPSSTYMVSVIEAGTEVTIEADIEAGTKASTEVTTDNYTKSNTENSIQASTKASTEVTIEAATEAGTKASIEVTIENSIKSNTENNIEASTKASTEVPIEADTEAGTKASTEVTIDNSTNSNTENNIEASTEITIDNSTKSNTENNIEASTEITIDNSTKSNTENNIEASTEITIDNSTKSNTENNIEASTKSSTEVTIEARTNVTIAAGTEAGTGASTKPTIEASSNDEDMAYNRRHGNKKFLQDKLPDLLESPDGRNDELMAYYGPSTSRNATVMDDPCEPSTSALIPMMDDPCEPSTSALIPMMDDPCEPSTSALIPMVIITTSQDEVAETDASENHVLQQTLTMSKVHTPWYLHCHEDHPFESALVFQASAKSRGNPGLLRRFVDFCINGTSLNGFRTGPDVLLSMPPMDISSSPDMTTDETSLTGSQASPPKSPPTCGCCNSCMICKSCKKLVTRRFSLDTSKLKKAKQPEHPRAIYKVELQKSTAVQGAQAAPSPTPSTAKPSKSKLVTRISRSSIYRTVSNYF